MKNKLAWIAALVAATSLSACNTVAGIGEDITSASEAVQKQISDEPKARQSKDDDELLGGPDGGL